MLEAYKRTHAQTPTSEPNQMDSLNWAESPRSKPGLILTGLD